MSLLGLPIEGQINGYLMTIPIVMKGNDYSLLNIQIDVAAAKVDQLICLDNCLGRQSFWTTSPFRESRRRVRRREQSFQEKMNLLKYRVPHDQLETCFFKMETPSGTTWEEFNSRMSLRCSSLS